jgi:hypothetical protein
MLRSANRSSGSLLKSTPIASLTSPAFIFLVSHFYQCCRSSFIINDVHLLHSHDLCAFEAGCCVSLMLIGEVGIFVDPNKRTASKFKIFDHELPKTIFWIIHFIVKYEGKIETFVNKSHKFINTICINVAQHTFCIEKGGYCSIDFVLFDYSFEVINICEIAN